MSKKDDLYKELEYKIRIEQEGINVLAKDFENLALGTEYLEKVHIDPEKLTSFKPGTLLPACIYTPHGLSFGFDWNGKSPFTIKEEDGVFYLKERGVNIFPLSFKKRPKFYSETTSDGVPMRWIANYTSNNTVRVTYSNQCCLQDKGLDCKFCHGDPARNHNGTSDQMKNPRQIGETYKRAIDLDEAVHFQLTGGFIPERREVEYYLDIAEALRDATGLENFHANACVGSPLDFTVFDKYKEVGFETIASNLEIWDEGIFKAICPGKEQECGGYKHWVEGLVYAAKVFGHGNVGSNFVAGLEPKDSLLEGVSYLSENGVVPSAGVLRPIPGSGLWGHRGPTVDWHINLGYEMYKIYEQNHFTWDNLWHVTPSDSGLAQDVYRIEKGLL